MSKPRNDDGVAGIIKDLKDRLYKLENFHWKGRHRVEMLDARVLLLNLSGSSNVSFTDLDITANTTENTIAAILYVEMNDTAGSTTDAYIEFRKNGTTSTALVVNASHLNGSYNRQQGIVAVDVGQVLEYSVHASGASTANVGVYLVGYIEQLS